MLSLGEKSTRRVLHRCLSVRRALAVVALGAAAPLCGQDIHPWLAGSGGAIYYDVGNVGVGTNAPDQRLTIQGSLVVRDYSGANGGQSLYVANTTSSGTNYGAVLQAVGSGALFNTGGYFNAGGGTYNYGVRIVGPAAATNNWAIYADATASSYFSGNVGIGTTNPTHKLAVNGTIRTKEVVVDTGWADYVFEPAYRVRPLNEINAYIQQHRRLPDMPSAEEVREKGVGVGEMQVKLLAKIEELTLQMIQMDRQNKELQARVAELESRRAQ